MAFYSGGTDLDAIFDLRATASIATVGFFVGGMDLSARYERNANGATYGAATGFLLANGNDIRTLFAAKGSITGMLYDVDNCFLLLKYITVFDGKNYFWSAVDVRATYGGVAGGWAGSLTQTVIGGIAYCSAFIGGVKYWSDTQGAVAAQWTEGVNLYQKWRLKKY